MKHCATRRWLIATVLAALAATSGSPSLAEDGSANELLTQARTAYAQRAKQEQARAAVDLFEKAVTAGAGYDAMWEGARAVYYLGEFPMGKASRGERVTMFERGKALAEKAVKSRPDGADGHFWLGSLTGTWGTARGVLKSLAVHGTVRSEGERAMKLDHMTECAGPYRLLGRYYFALPGFVGGDNQRSLRLLEKGVQLCPTNDLGRFYLADTLHALSRDDEARGHLEHIIATRPDPRFAPEYPFIKRMAKALLADL
jgi:hypothetical protein